MFQRIEEFLFIDSILRLAAEQNRKAATDAIMSIQCSNGTLKKAMCNSKKGKNS